MSATQFIAARDGEFEMTGFLTFETVPTLLDASKVWLGTGHEKVVINMATVDKADSAGLAMMLEWMHLARKSKVELTFINIPSQLASLIRISGLQAVFPIKTTN